MMKDEIKILMDQIESKDSEINSLNSDIDKLKGFVDESQEDNNAINSEVISKDTQLIKSLNHVADLKESNLALEKKLESCCNAGNPHSHPNNKKSACDDERVKKLTDENLKLKKKIETIEEAAEEKRTDQEC
jgi:chromosome segregation ATPase